ncbi:hypothetical protein PoB_004289200 [Plakobranchus ocellatus]|uniref:Uncharacterized protein n=1 Tax=Plakobranchus ocellatus TaxID=259542 RepID=A0AAV4BAC9_9GAST|nr:hypothetical protein PoB_004289200 [Plakobranchus ocellatus]
MGSETSAAAETSDLLGCGTRRRKNDVMKINLLTKRKNEYDRCEICDRVGSLIPQQCDLRLSGPPSGQRTGSPGGGEVGFWFLYMASPQQCDLGLSGPPSGQGTGPPRGGKAIAGFQTIRQASVPVAGLELVTDVSYISQGETAIYCALHILKHLKL